jgi:hypothetical protein
VHVRPLPQPHDRGSQQPTPPPANPKQERRRSSLPIIGQSNVHEAAQRIAPETRVVYVDNDPVVVRHGPAILATVEDSLGQRRGT